MASIEEQRNSPDGLQIPGLIQNQDTVEQLSFTIDPITPMPVPAAPQPDQVPTSMDGYVTPRPPVQAGSAEVSQPGFAKASGPSSSMSGLADLDTAHQPGVQVGTSEPRKFQPLVTPLPDPASSFSGLADMDTARRPISQAGIAEGEPARPTPSVIGSGPTSQPGISNAGRVTQTLTLLADPEKTGLPVVLSPGATRILPPLSQPGTMRSLGETSAEPRTTASRPPMVIRGTSQPNRTRTLRPPQGRRHVISLAGVGLLVVITLGMLLVASPIGQNVRSTFTGQLAGPSIVQNTPSNMSLVAQATATAVVHQENDGYAPGAGSGAVVTGAPESWPLGVCTYWANLRYHELTGHWVTWLGNAYQWADGARMAGWNVSSEPHVPSIIVLMPGVEGASGYGHVAVVESASGDSVYTSNMNWYADGGGWDIVSHYTFTAGPGVYFIWA